MVKDYLSEILTSRDPVSAFRKIPANKRGFILLSLPKRVQRNLLEKLDLKEIVSFLEYLDPDEITDLLQNLKEKERKKLLEMLGKERREKVEFLLKFDPRTAAGLMNLDYVEVGKDTTFEELSRIIKKHEKRTGKVPAVLVVEDGFLIGELPLHTTVLAKKGERIGKYIRKVPSIKYDKPEGEIVKEFKKHPHDKIVVLGDRGNILGVIYSDDILRLLGKRTGLENFAGISEEEDVLDPALLKVKHRYKWLILNLGTAFLAASVVAFFQKTIAAYVLLAAYMPIIAGMGGNAATQTLAVMVRGLTLGEIRPKVIKKVILNEIVSAGINGILIGLLTASVAILINQSPLLGLIVALSLLINLLVAGFFGSIVPLIMKKLGKDPASSATIFITTATDVFGFLAILGLATLIL
ncbi:MAG: magnesium transporter [Candidatus Aenigmatarchaeota archaeon]|nr:MAG: magnesium transporter [Candidatus Aenigmarchaeota archaeon]